MTQHFSRSTVSAAFHCAKCGKPTQHRIDDGRKGPCLACIERYDNAPKRETPAAQSQRSLFAAEMS
jgi:hypothetical protein